jgi:hypothetical protein
VIKNLVGHGADPTIKDVNAHSAVDVAMGLAQGHGRGGSGKVVHEDSAALLQQLMASGIKTADQPPVRPANQLL